MNTAKLADQKKSRLVALIDYLDIAAIFALFYHHVLHHFLESIGRYFLFPIAAVAGAIQSVFAWREAKRQGYTKSAVSKALFDTGLALAVNVSIIGILAFSAVFAVAAPIIFAASLGVKALYQLGTALYHGIKALRAKSVPEKMDHKKIARENAISSLVSAAVCASVLLVLVFGKVLFAGLGVLGGLAGASYAAYKYQESKQAAKKKALDQDAGKELSESAKIAAALNNKHTTQTSPAPQQLSSVAPNVTAKALETDPPAAHKQRKMYSQASHSDPEQLKKSPGYRLKMLDPNASPNSSRSEFTDQEQERSQQKANQS